MKTKFKNLFLIFLLSLGIELITSPLRGYYGFMTCSVVTFVIYFISVYYVLKKQHDSIKSFYILIAFLLGCSVLALPLHIADFKGTLVSFPDYIFHLLGIIMGFCFYFSNKYKRIIILVFSVSMCVFLYFKGYDMWLHKISYETFTGVIEPKQVDSFQFQSAEGDTISIQDFKGKYVLVDCWYTYCGICYKKMPQVQELYDRYKDKSETVIFALHSRISDKEENSNTGSNILSTSMGLTFPCFSIDIDNPVLKELGVNSYPTVLIFNKKSELVFRGSIENASRYITDILNRKKQTYAIH